MRTSIFIIISAVFLIKIITSERTVSQQADQLTGAQLYAKYCLTCHQADGNGVRGMFPPLAGNAKITGPSTDVIRIVLFGLEGPITVNERDYSQPMPPQGYLSDNQIADILTYIRSNWGNNAPPVKATDVAKTRKLGKVSTN
jgi:mono/diheme cytochrome c family protein